MERRKIVHELMKYIRDRAPREIHNDDIAKALGLERAQVRNSLRNWLAAHPGESDIVETSPYYYAANAHPVSGAPVNPVSYGAVVPTPKVNVAVPVTCEFTVIKRTKDVILLLDEEESIWVARRV